MQLKRDTDFSIRILYSIKNCERQGNKASAGLTVSDISARAGLPRLTVARLCETMDEKGILRSVPGRTGAERTYHSANGFLGYSLLDVIEAVEGTCRIFSVFDRNHPYYKQYGGQLEQVQRDMENVLANIPLSRLL